MHSTQKDHTNWEMNRAFSDTILGAYLWCLICEQHSSTLLGFLGDIDSQIAYGSWTPLPPLNVGYLIHLFIFFDSFTYIK